MTLARLLIPTLFVTLPVVGQAQVDKTTPKKVGAPASAAEAPVSHCIGCHSIPGYQASFPEVYRVPKIGGQSEQYMVAALRAYRQGDRNHPTMTAIARGLTDEQIEMVARYFAQRGRN